MVPVIDSGATVLTEMPSSEAGIRIGDIIFFKLEEHETNIVHRVIAIASDTQGSFYTTKGDNNLKEDPFVVRFDDINGVVIGIIY